MIHVPAKELVSLYDAYMIHLFVVSLCALGSNIYIYFGTEQQQLAAVVVCSCILFGIFAMHTE